jgi:hypothetical protein
MRGGWTDHEEDIVHGQLEGVRKGLEDVQLRGYTHTFKRERAYLDRELGNEAGLDGDRGAGRGEDLINLVRLDVHIVKHYIACKERHRHVVLVKAKEVVLKVLLALLEDLVLKHFLLKY